jgi:hypothetical protein
VDGPGRGRCPLAATACFVGCATEVSALGSGHSTPAAVLIGAAAAFAVGAVVLVRVAIRLEHRLRTAGPAARTAGPAAGAAGSGRRAARSGGQAAPSAVRRAPGRHPRNSPVTRIAGIVIIVGAGVTLTVVAFQLHSQAALSSYTQRHGLARSATVEAVRLVNHGTSHDSWTTYDYDVALAVPAGPASRTVAHDPAPGLPAVQPGRQDQRAGRPAAARLRRAAGYPGRVLLVVRRALDADHHLPCAGRPHHGRGDQASPAAVRRDAATAWVTTATSRGVDGEAGGRPLLRRHRGVRQGASPAHHRAPVPLSAGPGLRPARRTPAASAGRGYFL